MKTIRCSWFLAAILLPLLSVRSFAQGPPPLPANPLLQVFNFPTNFQGFDGVLPIASGNVWTTPVWRGNALVAEMTNAQPAFLHFHLVETNGNTNLSFSTGTIIFTVAPNWASADTNQHGTGPGQRCFFISAGDASSNAPHGFFGLFADSDGTNLYLCGLSNGVASTYVRAPISWASNVWHELDVEYSSSNSAIFVDGAIAATGTGVTVIPGTNTWTNGLWIASDSAGFEQARAAIWHMEIWDMQWGGFMDTNGWSNLLSTITAWQGTSGGMSFGMMSGLDGGTLTGNGYTPDTNYNTNYAQYTNFFLNIGVTNSSTQAVVSIMGSLSNLTYLILTNSVLDTNLADWGIWQTLTASNSVTVAPPYNIGTNSLFFASELILSTGTNQIADWWAMLYFKTLNVDPYADPDGDGLCNYSEYILGTNPTNAYSITTNHTDAQALFLAYTNDTTTRLWLSLTTGPGATNVTLTLSNTVVGSNYQIYSKDLSSTNNPWRVETNFLGTNTATKIIIPLNGRTLAFIGGDGEDPDGDGLSSGYEVLATHTDPLLADTGNTGVPDGYKDPDGDGFSNLEEYQNGTDPLVFNPPAGPSGLSVVFATNSSGVITNASLTWNPSPGSVLSYTILRKDDQGGLGFVPLTNIIASRTTFMDTNANFSDGIQYEIEANYSGGSSLIAGVSTPATTPLWACLIHGPDQEMYLGLVTIPQGTTAILLSLTPNNECGWGNGTNQTETISITSFTNGMHALSETEYPLYTAYTVTALAITPDSTNQEPVQIESDCEHSIRYPFLDGSHVLKDNLVANLQEQPQMPGAGTRPVELDQFEGLGLGTRSGYSIRVPVYAFASYHSTWYFDVDTGFYLDHPTITPLHVWEINALINNFLYQIAPPACWGGTNSGSFAESGASDWDHIELSGAYYFDSTDFALNQVTTPCPSWLGSPTNRAFGNMDPLDPLYGNSGGFTNVPSGPNAFGVPMQGTYLEYYNSTNGQVTTNLFNPGVLAPFVVYQAWEQYAAPSVQAQFYQFTTGGNLASLSPDTAGTNTVAVTNLLIAAVGDPNFTVSAWLRYELLNGYSGIYGYVEQYFDKAYVVTNSSVTTNQTGVLSPYGNFFATQPGVVALVTRTNIENGATGSGIVNVIRLSLDANHDGTMDESFTGPDNTSAAMPYTLWANDNFDRWTNDPIDSVQIEDGVSQAVNPGTQFVEPDYNYTNSSGHRAIPCPRDLEDYARLWVTGVSNTLSQLPSGSTVTLNWAGVGSSPTIDLFRAVETNGGIGYLTNIATASNQLATNLYVGRLGPGQNLQLNATNFSNNWAGDHFIWCGVAPGNDQLNLTISDGSGNVLAQSSQFIQIQDIKQMYERWTVGDIGGNPSGSFAAVRPMTNALLAQDNFSPGYLASPFQYPSGIDTNDDYILFVHGYNMESWEKDRYAETAYKRLYWQGYQGRFGSFRWPTYPTFLAFNNSERQAWLSGLGLRNKLTALNTQYPGKVYVLAHSMGNVVTGEALRQEGTNQVVNTYVASQAAVSARAYDNTIPTDATNYYAPVSPDSTGHYYTNTSPAYFNGIAGAGTFVNFINTNDWVLMGASSVHPGWLFNQQLKLLPYTQQLITPFADYFYTTPSSNHPSGYYYQDGEINPYRNLVFTNDTYEIFSMVAQSYSKALGAESNLPSQFSALLSVNLFSAPYNFGQLHVGHSFQFRSDNMTTAVYWNKLLFSFGIQP